MTDDIRELKARLKSTWMAGDFGHFARYMRAGEMEFFPDLGVRAGERVLDVACGAGQLSFPAARAGADVTGVDIATNLIEQARAAAAAQGLRVRFDEGDAEELPYPDASFDLVYSFVGAMFAPRPELVATEMTRVCRPGGRIAMANWTAAGFVGQMFKVSAKHVPPPAGMPSPVQWGDESVVRDRLGPRVATLAMKRRAFRFEYPFPPAGVVQLFVDYYGPTNRAFAKLDANGQAALRADLERLWTDANTAKDGTTRVDAEYLHVAAVR
jgi:SAM-dependent methyltransferase